MTRRETSKKIDDKAAYWAARTDGVSLSAEEQSELDRWLSADARHLGALARAQAISVHFERARALGPHFDPEQFAESHTRIRVTRRGAMILGTAAAAAVATGAVIIPRNSGDNQDRTFGTQIGETLSLPLEDGSVITLNTASQVAVSYTRYRRTAKLLGGEALFDVGKDPSRPFIVEAGANTVRAVGTSFAVLLLPNKPMTLVVREGVVELHPEASARTSIRIPANMRVVVPAEAPIRTMAISPGDIDRALSWREGRITFEGDSLGAAAQALARYSDTRIVFRDPSIARERITGLFVANDPVEFSKAVALGLGLRVTIGENQVELSR
jgi:transmembrane sensor